MLFESDGKRFEVWYRIEEKRYAASLDEFERPMGRGSLKLICYTYLVTKHTPKGVWLKAGMFSDTGSYAFGGKPRFVRREANKRFACPTRKEAYESFMARKKRQIRILAARLCDAEEALAKAQKEHEGATSL